MRGDVDHRLLRLKRRGGPSHFQETGDILFTKEGVGIHHRRGQHGALSDVTKVSRQVGEVKFPATVAEKGDVRSSNLHLMGEALGKSRDELIE